MKGSGRGIEIRMLGAFSITIDGKPQSFAYEKPKALCAYLIVEGRPLYREHIAELLWPDMNQFSSRQNLRQSLAAIKRVFGEEYAKLFKVNRQMIEFVGYQHCTIDTELLIKESQPDEYDSNLVLTRGGLTLLYNLYQGQFCHGFNLRGCDEFDDWLDIRRQEFKTHALAYARKLVNWFKSSRQVNHAIEIYRQMIALERYDEQLIREYMEFLIECDQRPMAISIYRDHERRLQAAYGTRPDARLSALHDYLTGEDRLFYSHC